ncbi:TPA: hypothetical protein DEP21_05700 [Patescibacteria group bacterium]|nr:hypothetical protein [Candidatus Gracilibacteria bacterium]
MVNFPKQYKDKKTTNNISSPKKTTKKSESISLDYFPFPLSKPLHVGHLYNLTVVDFLRLYHSFFDE